MPYPSGTETLGDIPLAAQFFDKGGEVYNVMHPDFGAVGDGVADDGPAINSALEEAKTGGVVVVPPGSYKLDTAVVFPGAADKVLLWVLPGVSTSGTNPTLPTGSGTNLKLDWSDPGGGSTVFTGYPVTTAQIADGAVTTVKLGDASVTSGKIGNDQVTTAKIGDSQVTTVKMNDGSVTTAKIGDSQVTTTKINDGSVVEAKIGSQAVTTTKLGDSAVTQIKMGSGLFVPEIVSALPSLPDASYPQGAVVVLTTDNKLYRSTGSAWTVAVPTTDLTGQITETQVTDGAISTPKLAANAVTAAKIAAGTITTTEIASDTIVAGNIAAGAIGTSELAAGAVVAAKIAAGTITAAQIAAGTITANEIAASTITATELNISSLDAISADIGTITAGTIQANVIIGASTFTNTSPVFEGSLAVEGGDGQTKVSLSAVSAGGYAAFYLDPAGAPTNHIEGEIEVFENVGWDEFTITAQDRLRLISGDGTGDEDITLEPARDVDFQTATDTGKSATSDFMRIRINGTVRYLLLYN